MFNQKAFLLMAVLNSVGDLCIFFLIEHLREKKKKKSAWPHNIFSRNKCFIYLGLLTFEIQPLIASV